MNESTPNPRQARTLYVKRRDCAIDKLSELIGEAGLTIAFVSTPDKFYVSRIDGKNLTFVDDDGQPQPLDEATLAKAYEVRAFGSEAEVRWTRDGRSGCAIVLTEDRTRWPDIEAKEKRSAILLKDREGASIDCIDRLERKYFLWGEAADNKKVPRPDRWSAVSASRIGKVLVPLPEDDGLAAGDAPGQRAKRRLKLRAFEYIESGPHGNAVVRAERYVEFFREVDDNKPADQSAGGQS
jgi:CRISPR-associated protein (TIGR03984 family)